MRKDKYYPLLYKRAQPSRCAFIKVNASSGTRSKSESVREHVGSLLLKIYFFQKSFKPNSDLFIGFWTQQTKEVYFSV